MASKLLAVRVPDALLELLEVDAMQGETTAQAIILQKVAASYGLEIDPPRRGGTVQYDPAKVKALKAKGKSVAAISEKLGISKTRVYELLAEE